MHPEANGQAAESAVFVDCPQKQRREMPSVAATVPATANATTAAATDPMLSRKISSGTLNRLILVAQALESEVDTRRRTDLHGGRVVCAIRAANIIVLFLVNALLFSGIGQYQDERGQTSLSLTPDKWVSQRASMTADLPASFSEMALGGQLLAGSLASMLLGTSLLVQFLTACDIGNARMMSLALSLTCVPCTLLIFGLQMHYSGCPWLDDFYRVAVLSRRRNGDAEGGAIFDPQCGINGWALAGIFSLLSCALFVAEGLTTTFVRSAASASTAASWRAQRKHVTAL